MMKPKLHTSCDLHRFHSYARKHCGNYVCKGFNVACLCVHHTNHVMDLTIGNSELMNSLKDSSPSDPHTQAIPVKQLCEKLKCWPLQLLTTECIDVAELRKAHAKRKQTHWSHKITPSKTQFRQIWAGCQRVQVQVGQTGTACDCEIFDVRKGPQQWQQIAMQAVEAACEDSSQAKAAGEKTVQLRIICTSFEVKLVRGSCWAPHAHLVVNKLHVFGCESVHFAGDEKCTWLHLTEEQRLAQKHGSLL